MQWIPYDWPRLVRWNAVSLASHSRNCVFLNKIGLKRFPKWLYFFPSNLFFGEKVGKIFNEKVAVLIEDFSCSFKIAGFEISRFRCFVNFESILFQIQTQRWLWLKTRSITAIVANTLRRGGEREEGRKATNAVYLRLSVVTDLWVCASVIVARYAKVFSCQSAFLRLHAASMPMLEPPQHATNVCRLRWRAIWLYPCLLHC